jgi:hypothetical protein
MIATIDGQTLLCSTPVMILIVHREFALISSQERMKAHYGGVMTVAEHRAPSHF